MKIEITKSPIEINSIATLFQTELVKEDLYGTVYTSPKLASFLNGMSAEGIDQFLVARQSGLLLGAIQFRTLSSAFHINNIAVNSDYHGQKIGRLLIDWLIDKASCSKKNLTLDVSLRNDRALRWYRNFGFLETAHTSNFVFLCGGNNSLDELFTFQSMDSLEKYGFSDAKLMTDVEARFFCVMDHYVRLKTGFTINFDEISWFKGSLQGVLVLNSKSTNKKNGVNPYFIQETSRMELKCG